MLEKDPGATPVEIRSALAESAVPVGAFGSCAVGAGRVDAVVAIEQLLTPAPNPDPPCTPPVSEPWKAIENDGGTVPAPIPVASDIATPTESPPPTRASDGRPRTFFLQRPPRLVRTRANKAKVVFRFGSNEADVTFVCRVDGAPFRSCPGRFVRRFRIGFHVLRVVARDAAGNVDRTPAIARFRVKRAGG